VLCPSPKPAVKIRIFFINLEKTYGPFAFLRLNLLRYRLTR
jgi:hypothetical protein